MILIVEDHAATGKGLLALLNRAFPLYKLCLTESAESALEQCEAEVPDLVIMDISLPRMNGIEATRRLKALCPQTHVVMHSSNDMKIFQDESTTAGASAFVSKRYTFSELIPAIARLLPSAVQP